MAITPFIHKDLVSANLKSRSKEGVIAEIVDAIDRRKHLKHKKDILKNLLDRETKGSTGIGEGVAIPHARIEGLKGVIVFAGLSRQGVDFASLDGKPARLVILFLTPLEETETHLKLLAGIAALLRNKRLVDRIRNARDSHDLYHALTLEEIDRTGFLSLAKEDIYQELDTGDRGLNDDEARRRLERYGPNELKKFRKTPLFRRFFDNFTGTLALLMWVGAALAFLVNTPQIGWAIIAVIFINAVFSFWQEFKAEKALEALKQLIPGYVRALRGGKEKNVLSREIVPGDIIVVEEGDSIPADARLIEAHELRVDNSVFSGESRPGYKSAATFGGPGNLNWTELPNIVFAGTSVVSGAGKGVVIATGMSTEIGNIAYLTLSVKMELSPLQKEIKRLTKLIALIAVVTGLVFLFVGITFADLSVTAAAIFAIGIILSNVPEGLMPTVTLSLAIAVQRMAKRHALIKKLSSVETLGSTDVICTDKTGTITMNQLTVRRVWINDRLIEITGSSFEPQGEFIRDREPVAATDLRYDNFDLLIKACILCSTARLVPPAKNQKYWTVLGDPTEGALIVLGEKAGFDIGQIRESYPYVKRFPFEAIRKRMSSVNVMEDKSLQAFVKGAPRELLDLSPRILLRGTAITMTQEMKQQLAGQIDRFASEGLRVLGIASRDVSPQEVDAASAQSIERDLAFLGLVAMYDPPRPEIKDAIASCRKAGIRVVMITGDYGLTALAISKLTGIVSSDNAEIITGKQLNEMKDEELKARLGGEVIFARVNPEHKLRVVNAFKERGHIVAVTGDGVNDAPALKQADIGVAMGIRGTDVAKESAEMILTDDNFASIVHAIEEGRAVFDNIKKFMTYIFAHLVPEAVPFILYVIFRLPVPITALQILAIDLGTETLPAIALGTEKPEPGIMELPPRPRKKGLVDTTVLFRGYVFLGLLNTAAVLAAYFVTLYGGGWRPGVRLEPDDATFADPLHLKAMTMLFAGIVVMQVANIFACRSDKTSVFRAGFLSNPPIMAGIVFELIFIGALIYVPFFQKIFSTAPLGTKDWGLLAGFMAIIFFAEELRKLVARKLFSNA